MLKVYMVINEEHVNYLNTLMTFFIATVSPVFSSRPWVTWPKAPTPSSFVTE
jgi:hypothetical protein